MKKVIFMFTLSIFGCGSHSLNDNGEQCEESDDCKSEMCLQELDDNLKYPDGFCAQECDVFEQTGCSEEEVCVRYTPTDQSFCYEKCYASDGCRDGWQCFNVSFFEPMFVCIPKF